MIRILALETSAKRLKWDFIESDEEELGTCRTHFLFFVLPMMLYLPVTVALAVMVYTSLEFGWSQILIYNIFFAACFLIGFFRMLKFFVEWKYNIIVITSEKIIIVRHRSIFYRDIDPIPLDNIISVRAETQFLGMFNCGILHLHLKQREDASTREIQYPYIRSPEIHAGTIQKAVAKDKEETSGIPAQG